MRIAPVRTVWFCGVHSDVGGWYLERGLSDIALDWTCRRPPAPVRAGCRSLAAHPLRPDLRGPIHEAVKVLFRLPGLGGDRTIGLSRGSGDGSADPTQSVHPSVLPHWDEDGDYRPGALRTYLRRAGDPRA